MPSWTVSGNEGVSREFAAPAWVKIHDGAPTREAAVAWLRSHVDQHDYPFYLLAISPKPPGKPVDRPASWCIYEVDRFGRIVSARDGRPL